MSATPYAIKKEAELVFSFVSEGKKGKIVKIVKYQEFLPGHYNLAFGDQQGDTLNLDDKVNSDNGDMQKVLATVIQTMDLFFEKRPFGIIFFKGSTPGRTLLYQRIIKNYRHLFEGAMYFYGGTEEMLLEAFSAEKQYQFFWASKFPLT